MLPVWRITRSCVIWGEVGSRPMSFSDTTTCAELDTGKSSARPCTMARITTCRSVMEIPWLGIYVPIALAFQTRAGRGRNNFRWFQSHHSHASSTKQLQVCLLLLFQDTCN